MANAARAIIIEDGKILLMHRNKNGKQYFTLVGGRVQEGETSQQALVREVKEETGLEIVNCRLVFKESHSEPYNSQYIFICEVMSHGEVAIQKASEEAMLNKISTNLHQPLWVDVAKFGEVPFMTMNLQSAIKDALKKGFPATPISL